MPNGTSLLMHPGNPPRAGELLSLARQIAIPFKASVDVQSGSVGAALLSATGRVFTGVCIDAACGLGFCAEHAAVAEMLKARESQIVMMVAVNDEGRVMAPCGRCRELFWQLDKRNLEMLVIFGGDRVAKLSQLLPERGPTS